MCPLPFEIGVNIFLVSRQLCLPGRCSIGMKAEHIREMLLEAHQDDFVLAALDGEGCCDSVGWQSDLGVRADFLAELMVRQWWLALFQIEIVEVFRLPASEFKECPRAF